MNLMPPSSPCVRGPRAIPMPACLALGTALLAGSAHAAEPPAAPAAPDVGMLYVFVLATFIGLGVVLRVSRLLHTPLMSLTNAISAIAVVGSIAITGQDHPGFVTVLGGVALFASMTNIVSGFLITDRMLKMFKRPEAGKS